jgi:lysophospholipase L1-like esterase
MGKPQSHLRILCFGDSLTAGYASYGTVYHPYAREVQRRLAAVLPKPKPVVEDDGVPGETAGHPDFIGRMREQCKFSKRLC